MPPPSETPLFSIVTPSFNQARYLPETISSLRAQEGVDFEHLVLDNCSTDGSADILREYAKTPRVSVIIEPDSGQADAINKGWKQSCGRWLAWLNADDLYEPGALLRVKREIEAHPEARWMIGEFRIINESGQRVGRLHSAYKNALLRHYSYHLLLSENIIPQMSVFIREDLWREAGLVDTVNPLMFDYEYWLRLGKLAPPHIIPEVLSVFRYHSGSITGRNFRTQFAHELECAQRYARQIPDMPRWPLILHRINYYKTIWFYDLVKRF